MDPNKNQLPYLIHLWSACVSESCVCVPSLSCEDAKEEGQVVWNLQEQAGGLVLFAFQGEEKAKVCVSNSSRGHLSHLRNHPRTRTHHTHAAPRNTQRTTAHATCTHTTIEAHQSTFNTAVFVVSVGSQHTVDLLRFQMNFSDICIYGYLAILLVSSVIYGFIVIVYGGADLQPLRVNGMSPF